MFDVNIVRKACSNPKTPLPKAMKLLFDLATPKQKH